ncbi:Glycosyltransferase involved in cell wall bisynthesis [Robiginitalea myxolifaciens]|uniref:Glycosyltransferase involved in cell wall bisynthesis n=2 Tax=Robiginitalea myxolifaciens TaxID=400055 RepID=A0A1I6H8E0_9FLAO|nr:Glycosyltransferase involved in cell wall bisynthesis [Robiginitalea myxolifaciens]
MKDSRKDTGLSVLMITYNEISNIARCLNAVDFATEIIVVDSGSTDGTYEYLLNRPGVRVIRKPFRNFTEQKNFALDQARQPWVLFVDADEEVSPELAREIREVIARNDQSVSAYWFYRKFMFKNIPLQFSGWQTDKNIRLFRKDCARYSTNRLVHEKLDIKGKTAALKNQLLHYCYRDFASYKQKMVLYGRLKAQEVLEGKRRPKMALLLLKPIWKFCYNYLFRLGILDGMRGVTICYLDAYGYLVQFRMLRGARARKTSTSTTVRRPLPASQVPYPLPKAS